MAKNPFFGTFIKRRIQFQGEQWSEVNVAFCCIFRSVWQINSSTSWPTVGAEGHHFMNFCSQNSFFFNWWLPLAQLNTALRKLMQLCITLCMKTQLNTILCIFTQLNTTFFTCLSIPTSPDALFKKWSIGLGEIGLVGLKFKIKTRPLTFGQEI